MILVAPRDSTIRQRLTAELALIEQQFVAELHSDLPCVNQLVRHIERYRGKRLRPMLVIVAGMASAADCAGEASLQPAHRVVATVLEMVHMATLVHDDVLDEAQTRRGGATLNSLRGNESAVMLGDYVVSHAYHLCTGLGNPELSRMISSVTNTVCEGELLQLANRENWQLSETTYFDIIRRKTASLVGVCCRTAAVINGCAERVVTGLEVYGERLGLAFQIVDDVLDLTGRESTVGKTLGLDLQKGKLTLPVIHLLNHGSASARKQAVELLKAHVREPDGDGKRVAMIRDLMVSSGGLAYASERAEALIAEAKDALAVVPDSPARDLLAEVAGAVITRRF